MLRRSSTMKEGRGAYEPLAGGDHADHDNSSFGRSNSAAISQQQPYTTNAESPQVPAGGSIFRAYQNIERYARQFGTLKSPRGNPTGSQTPTRPAMSADVAARAALALSALGALALFPPKQSDRDNHAEDDEDEEDEQDEDEEDEEEEGSAWLFRQGVIIKLLLVAVSLAAAALGIVMQIIPYFRHVLGSHVVHFRWLAFLGGCAPTYFVLKKAIGQVFVWIELYCFRDSLAYLANLKRATVHMTFIFTELVVFHLLFKVIFCHGVYREFCRDANYKQRASFAERWILCGGIFALASFIACLAAKILSTHFYKSTHFKKFKDALNREYILHTLSMPKRKAILQHQQSSAEVVHAAEVPSHPHGAGALLHNLESMLSPNRDIPKHVPESAGSSCSEASGRADGAEHHKDAHTEAQSPFSSKEQGPGSREHPDLKTNRERQMSQCLTKEMVATVPLAIPEATPLQQLEDEDKLERLRTAVVVKTYSKLMHVYGVKLSSENEERMLRRVKAFSRALFKNIAWNGSETKDFITLEDFELFFEPTKEGKAKAKAAFDLFDRSSLGRVTRDQTETAVLSIFNERATIASALEDTDSIVQSLESGFAGGLHFLSIAFYMLIWKINLVAGFTTFSAIMVGLSFVFGNSIRIMFESLLFLFGEHPYDVGDWVEIDGAMYEVRKVRLLYTVMLSGNNRTVYISSKELLEKRIINMSRSPSHMDFMTPEVDVGIARHAKEELIRRMDAHIAANPTEYQGAPLVILKTLSPCNMKVTMMIGFTFNFNADDFDRTFAARDSMVQLISDTFAELRGSSIQHTTATIQSFNAPLSLPVASL